MHVIWKRPDGFLDATPDDFTILEINDQARIWLHKSEREWFPFQVSGDWKDSSATRRLNLLVNLLRADDQAWARHLLTEFHDSLMADAGDFFDETSNWLEETTANLKGDVWEVDVMGKVVAEIKERLANAQSGFEKLAHG